ncbi:S8/S53 family peptidase [Streptomyces sp. WAC04114]|uniref:S8 family peptidase n=1 Tax=Streptomyces sp. WAC04114 TaxID=2867961 RepID=UPI001C8C3B19|nr:S8/S53 family peptidase [Streptomyces sp. WAC04114]MBX9363224.1 S8/S53 family peptidase [Streptomyces sp. WAC04114]
MRIGHPDTGYVLHPELEPDALDLMSDLDLLSGDDDARDPLVKRWWFPFDTPGHGTHTGSVIASRERGQVCGVAPESTLVPIRTITSVTQVFDGDVAKAVRYTVQAGCQVVSLSLGGLGFNGLRAAIRHAVAQGLIVVAAAGQRVGFVVAPAVYPECVAAAASTADDRPWPSSSHGPAVDICAPGERIWVAEVDAASRPPVFRVSNTDHDGTSYATAHMAGVAALWVAHHGHAELKARYGAEQIQSVFLHLLGTAGHRRPAGWDTGQWGAGIVDAEALLSAPLPAAVPVLRRFTAGADLPTPWEPLAVVLPELGADEIEERLAGLARHAARPLVDVTAAGVTASYAAEMARLLAENPVLRARFVEDKPGTAAGLLLAEIGSAGSWSLADAVGCASPRWV